jgi:dephospho-CoA kinase
MKIVGLTGSIAMGKSDTLRMFAEAGIPTFDADHVVHRLYARGGRGVTAVERLCPAAVVDGAVDRRRLSEAIETKPSLLAEIERAVHPLVRQELDRFLEDERAKQTELVVIDVPLLFETRREKEFDSIVVVSAPPHVQKSRAMARPDMTEEKFNLILSRQTPDAEKRARAHFIVDTGAGHESARSQVRRIVSQLLS